MGEIIQGDALSVLQGQPAESVQCCVTSPPYWGLRDYGVEGQLGLEPTPEEYTARMVEIFAEVRRVLKADGTLWLNLGDSYSAHPGQRKNTDKAGEKQQTKRGSVDCPSHHVAGLKPKDLVGIPWRVAFALQADGWYLRQDIIWSKPNPMPESVQDRCTKAHEYIFLLSKSQKYYYDADAIAEASSYPDDDRGSRNDSRRGTGYNQITEGCGNYTTRNKRSVWTVATQPYPEAHFATFPPDLIKPCIMAGCPERGIVLDPFVGSGTTAFVADSLNRDYRVIELNPEYIPLIERRLAQMRLPL